jgi:hypothetical protein
MRYILGVWALPLVLFWGWFGLSYYDVNFGYVLMTRQAHDIIFELYGDVLGLDPATIPWLVAKACIFDTSLLLAIWGFRRRREIAARFRRWQAPRPSEDQAEPASEAPLPSA